MNVLEINPKITQVSERKSYFFQMYTKHAYLVIPLESMQKLVYFMNFSVFTAFLLIYARIPVIMIK